MIGQVISCLFRLGHIRTVSARLYQVSTYYDRIGQVSSS
jgi:hypothetical protein